MFKKSIAMMVVLMMLGLLLACGPAGPAGSAGPRGPAGPAGLPGEDAVTPTARIVISPASGVAKTPIIILGTGFVPGEKVEAIMNVSAPIALGRVGEGGKTIAGSPGMGGDPMTTVSEDGTFKIKTVIPQYDPRLPKETAIIGVYTITVTGDKGSVAAFPLDVVEAKK